MKRALLLGAVLLFFAPYAPAQTQIQGFAADPVTCDPTRGLLYYNTVSQTFKSCTSVNAWTPFGGVPPTGTSGQILYINSLGAAVGDPTFTTTAAGSATVTGTALGSVTAASANNSASVVAVAGGAVGLTSSGGSAILLDRGGPAIELDTTGRVNVGANGTNPIYAGHYNALPTCLSSASPAVCSGSSSGFVVIAAASSTVTVDTTAVTANSQIFVQSDDSLGTALSVTCNSTGATLVAGLAVTARTAGTSFQITSGATPAVNPLCISFLIVN